MSTGSVNSFNASLSPSSNRWLKHQIKEIQGKSSCNSLISPESLPLFKEAPSEERKTILTISWCNDFEKLQGLFKFFWICEDYM